MKREKFGALVQLGHKGPAIVLPFDPAAVWGKKSRQFVEGAINGCNFEGEVGYRRRVHYTILDEKLLKAAKLTAGDMATVSMRPRERTAAELESDAKLAWSRCAGEASPDRERELRAIAKNGLPFGNRPTRRPS